MSLFRRSEEPSSVIRAVLAGTGPASSRGRGLKAVLIAIGGLAGVTAASAGISSLRRREEKTKDVS
jgi:hypothetical protein